MNAARRNATVLFVLAVLALATVGCGVKAKDGGTGGTGGTTETTTPSDTDPSTTEPSTDTTEAEDPTDTTEGPTDTTEDTTDTTIGEFGDFGKESLVELYTDMGLTEEQASCLVDAIFDSTTNGQFDPDNPPDQSAVFDYLATCEIDITDFGGAGG